MDHNQNTIATINHQRAIRIKLYHHSWLFHRLLKKTGRCRGEIETLRNYNGDGIRERLKHNRFYEQNNNSARESRFFVHFFAVPAQLRREMNKFWVDLRTGTARRWTLPSLCEFGRGPLSSVPSQLRFFQGTGWLGIRAKKFRRTKRLFSSDVFIGIAVVGS